VRFIEEQHPQVREAASGIPTLDTLAVVKASQALSSRIDPDELIEELLRIALESAGAQTGRLYFVERDELLLSAVARVQGEQLQVRVLHDGQADVEPRPQAILNYVRRSREPVLLDDGTQPGPLSNDEYVQQFRPKSVLCLPLLRRTELFGVLYLENNLSTHAF
jgi:GAF domain-containing protein